MKLNVLDFPAASIGESAAIALEMAMDGDALYFPGVQLTNGQTYHAPSGGFQIAKSLEIYGDGPGDAGIYTGTIFTAPAGGPVFSIVPPGPSARVHLHDFKIKTPPTPSGGIQFGTAVAGGTKSVRIERVNLLEVGGVGFDLSAASIDANLVVAFVDSAATGGLGRGIELRKVLSARCVRLLMNNNLGGGAWCEFGGTALYLPAFDNVPNNTAVTAGPLKFSGARVARVDAGHFESFSRPGTVVSAVEFEDSGGAAMIGGSSFGNENPVLNASRGILVDAGPVVVLPNQFTRLYETLVEATVNAEAVVVMPQFNNPSGLLHGHVVLPGGPANGGQITFPYVRRSALISEDVAGVIVPSAEHAPPADLQEGTLFYSSSQSALLVNIGGLWKTIVVGML